MIETIIGAITPGIIVGIVLFYWERRQKKQDTHRKEQEEIRAEKEVLQLDLQVATAELSYATAMALKRGTPNGEMESAMERYNTAMGKFRRFERKYLVVGAVD